MKVQWANKWANNKSDIKDEQGKRKKGPTRKKKQKGRTRHQK